jgi:hypothetical protein
MVADRGQLDQSAKAHQTSEGLHRDIVEEALLKGIRFGAQCA